MISNFYSYLGKYNLIHIKKWEDYKKAVDGLKGEKFLVVQTGKEIQIKVYLFVNRQAFTCIVPVEAWVKEIYTIKFSSQEERERFIRSIMKN